MYIYTYIPFYIYTYLHIYIYIYTYICIFGLGGLQPPVAPKEWHVSLMAEAARIGADARRIGAFFQSDLSGIKAFVS